MSKVVFEKKCEGSERVSHSDMSGTSFPGQGTASAKALWQEHAQPAQGRSCGCISLGMVERGR